jgi:hypothetical protein
MIYFKLYTLINDSNPKNKSSGMSKLNIREKNTLELYLSY